MKWVDIKRLRSVFRTLARINSQWWLVGCRNWDQSQSWITCLETDHLEYWVFIYIFIIWWIFIRFIPTRLYDIVLKIVNLSPPTTLMQIWIWDFYKTFCRLSEVSLLCRFDVTNLMGHWHWIINISGFRLLKVIMPLIYSSTNLKIISQTKLRYM